MEYTQSELVLLKYANGYSIKSSFPNYFSTLHNLDTTATIKKFMDDDLLKYAPISYVLEKCTASMLKDFLAIHNMKIKGSKSELVQGVLDSFDISVLESYFTEKYYILTPKGEEYLNNNLSDEKYDNRCDFRNSICFETFDEALSYIKNAKYNQAAEALLKSKCSPAINHTNYRNFNAFMEHSLGVPNSVSLSEQELKHYLLLFYLYSLRAESVVKEFKERLNVVIPLSYVSKALKIIRAYDDIISAQEMALKLEGSGLKYIYTIRTCNDEKTCPICSGYEGVDTDILDARIGENYPPFNACKCEVCRCFAELNLC